jgi:uncharacterized membrane protein YeaQ/YmgE (transglycosylase-associated protein family)
MLNRVKQHHELSVAPVRLAHHLFWPTGHSREGVTVTVESLLVFLLVGAVAGWLAGLLVKGSGFGILGDIIVGIIGAFVAGWLFPTLGVSLGSGIVAAILHAAIGAVLFLVVLRLLKRA